MPGKQINSILFHLVLWEINNVDPPPTLRASSPLFTGGEERPSGAPGKVQRSDDPEFGSGG